MQRVQITHSLTPTGILLAAFGAVGLAWAIARDLRET
jgi:hypothetical protein